MKAAAIVLILLGFVAGCARQQSQSPSASAVDRPDLVHKSASACAQAGRQWIATSGVCL